MNFLKVLARPLAIDDQEILMRLEDQQRVVPGVAGIVDALLACRAIATKACWIGALNAFANNDKPSVWH